MPDSRALVVEGGWARLGRRILLCASEEGRFFAGNWLLVRTDRGDMCAKALCDSTRLTIPPDQYVRVVRRLPDAEAAVLLARLEARKQEARTLFIELVRRHQLDMHLSDVECLPGDSRVTFYFTAPTRVDFRALVRDLAAGLRTRIDLRQIGVRDEARCTGGLGPCGLPLCCSTFLRDFTAVSIRMAKVQRLVPNPQKVSGLCGRLMCCLAYEHDVYLEMMKAFPKVGTMVSTPKGEGKVKELLVMRKAVKVSFGPGQVEDFPLEAVKVLDSQPADAEPEEPVADEIQEPQESFED